MKNIVKFSVPHWCTFGSWFHIDGTVYQYIGVVKAETGTVAVAKTSFNKDGGHSKDFIDTVRLDPRRFLDFAEPCGRPLDPVVWDHLDDVC